MPTVRNRTTILGSSVNDNLLTGSQWLYLPYNAAVAFGINGDANGADLRIDVYSGTDILMENAPGNTQNRIPVWPDDYDLTDVAMQGELLKIRVRNLNVANRDVIWAVKIDPL